MERGQSSTTINSIIISPCQLCFVVVWGFSRFLYSSNKLLPLHFALIVSCTSSSRSFTWCFFLKFGVEESSHLKHCHAFSPFSVNPPCKWREDKAFICMLIEMAAVIFIKCCYSSLQDATHKAIQIFVSSLNQMITLMLNAALFFLNVTVYLKGSAGDGHDMTPVMNMNL